MTHEQKAFNHRSFRNRDCRRWRVVFDAKTERRPVARIAVETELQAEPLLLANPFPQNKSPRYVRGDLRLWRYFHLQFLELVVIAVTGKIPNDSPGRARDAPRDYRRTRTPAFNLCGIGNRRGNHPEN